MKIKTEKLPNGKIKITSPLGKVLELTEAEYTYFNYKAKQAKKFLKQKSL